MIRRRASALLAIASYLLAIVVVPVLHRLHHLKFGADHVHTAAGTIYLASVHDAGHYHAEFDRIFADLGLAEVASAGTLTIDCAYTDYTLATCDVSATPNHPRTFGDDLLAHSHEHRATEGHGDGSLEHGQAHYLCAAPIVLPLPSQPLVALALPLAHETPSLPFLRTRDSRGPPSA